MKLSYAVAAAALMLTTACAKKTLDLKEPSDPTGEYIQKRNAAIDEMMRNFQRVHFEFDSAQITPDTRDALAANVEIMNRFPELELEVQGHCDEQGATEYNLALGQRRADAIRKYMVVAGVTPKRVDTISFGEERPLSAGQDEGAWAK